MPTRMLREGILDSEAVNSLSWGAEVFYRRLMSVVDDFGRFDGRVMILRGRLYAAKLDTVREADIPRWIAECEKAGLIALYTVDGKPYILFHKLGQPRAKVSKFPDPPADVTQPDRPAKTLYTSVNGCIQMHTDADGCIRTHTDAPYSYSYSVSDSGSKDPPTPQGGGGGKYPALPADGTGPDPGKPPAERPVAGPVRGSPAAPQPAVDAAPERFEPFAAFVAAWVAAGLDRGEGVEETTQRRGWWQSRLMDPAWRARWREAVARLGRSERAKGRGADGWKGILPHTFLRDPDTLVKALEGDYDDPPPAGPKAAARRPGTAAGMSVDDILARAKQGGSRG